ncbi:Crinkler (CRN) [Phytophthora megakarya]|uniref:Crinkler (CRN) n=1 Tax=Phytophthora megakarya TaxID=4795 RepID=A0A225V5B4_9STRA|nr:Crinkler (CRN) [Phytophthora megakarya]
MCRRCDSSTKYGDLVKAISHSKYDQPRGVKAGGIRSGQVHVLIVVPEEESGVFNRCNNLFFNQAPRVDKVNNLLEFSSMMPLTQCRTLYVRLSYKSSLLMLL